jgi:molybdopterin-containing oxidoreductase family membrane subunit
VAGAVYSGFAMVLTLAIPVRRWYHLEDLITMRHIECMSKVMLATGLIVAYGYGMEAFMAWYSGNQYERYAFVNRMWAGGYWWTYWILILCNIVIPQALWSRRVRMSIPAVFVIALVVNVGMWLERFVIVVTSLTRDFVPSSWGMYYPTIWDWSTYAGTIGVFLALMFLFIRGLPAISIFEMREVVHHAESHVEPTHVP